MGKHFLLLAISLLVISSVYSCPSKGVEIAVNTGVENVFVGVIEGSRFYDFGNNSIKYFSLNSRDIAVEVSNESIVMSVVHGSSKEASEFNWEEIIRSELLWINNSLAVNLTEADINAIASKGCCGVIENKNNEWLLDTSECSDEDITLVWKDTSFNWLAIIISFLPGLVFFVYYSRRNRNLWKAFFIGGLGWFVSYMAGNVPKMLPISALGREVISTVVYVLYASILTGVFEEGIRYLILKKAGNYVKSDKNHVLSMALGWGVTEALTVYVGAVLTNVIMIGYPVTFLELLPGALERTSAVLMHIGFSFIVLKSVKKIKWLITAMGLHALVDFTAVTMLLPLGDVWLIEGILFVVSVAVLLVGHRIISEKKLE